MSSSIRDIKKRKGRPKTTGLGTGVLVRLHDEQINALDAWIAAQFVPMTRPEAIRTLIELGLDYGTSGAQKKQKKTRPKTGRG